MQFAQGTYVEALEFFHSFYLEYGRMPKFTEMPFLIQKLWNHNTATSRTYYSKAYHGQERHVRHATQLGYHLECAIHKWLVDNHIPHEYNSRLDVYLGVDFMICDRPVQVKSSRYFEAKTGFTYLVIDDFNGVLTSAHQRQLHAFIDWLKHN